MDLLAYAPNADMHISADTLIIDNGTTLNFTSNGRRIDLFANRVIFNQGEWVIEDR